VRRDDPSGWYTKSGSGVRLYGALTKTLKESIALAMLVRRLHAEMDATFGAEVYRCKKNKHRTIFVNCPNATQSWTVPSDWHSDMPFLASEPKLPRVLYAFAYLDQVEARGGGTMLISGSSARMRSHEMLGCWGRASTVEETRSFRSMQRLCQENEWFENLIGPQPLGKTGDYRLNCSAAVCAERVQRFMIEGTISGGVPMRVIELTGAPGDIDLWDPRCLHSQSNNARDRPRSCIRFRLERVAAT